MLKSNVAVLDIRSSDITAVVGERGVNGTFTIKSKFSSSYDGYAEGELLDIGSFNHAVREVVSNIFSSAGQKIKSFYVGVPGEFLKVEIADKAISFAATKKIKNADVDLLKNVSKPQIGVDYTIIRCECQYYSLGDKRRTVDPVGAASDMLRGKLCYYECRSAFIECVKNAFAPFSSVTHLRFIPTVHAEAVYLVAPERRDEYAILFDLGFISSTYSVICGNAVAFSESFSVGIGHVAVYLMAELEIPYQVALLLMGQVNLNFKDRVNQKIECRYENKLYCFAASLLREKIKEGLDGICETIEECKQNYTGVDLDGKTVFITGDCVNTVKGTVEHISNRLVKNVEIISPNLPYYDKPQFSSLFSLLNMALSDEK